MLMRNITKCRRFSIIRLFLCSCESDREYFVRNMVKLFDVIINLKKKRTTRFNTIEMLN